jgi:hypothetical protein
VERDAVSCRTVRLMVSLSELGEHRNDPSRHCATYC